VTFFETQCSIDWKGCSTVREKLDEFRRQSCKTLNWQRICSGCLSNGRCLDRRPDLSASTWRHAVTWHLSSHVARRIRSMIVGDAASEVSLSCLWMSLAYDCLLLRLLLLCHFAALLIGRKSCFSSKTYCTPDLHNFISTYFCCCITAAHGVCMHRVL